MNFHKCFMIKTIVIQLFLNTALSAQYLPDSIGQNQEKGGSKNSYEKITGLYKKYCSKLIDDLESTARLTGYSKQEIHRLKTTADINASYNKSGTGVDEEIIKMAYFALENAQNRYPTNKLKRDNYCKLWNTTIEMMKSRRNQVLSEAQIIGSKSENQPIEKNEYFRDLAIKFESLARTIPGRNSKLTKHYNDNTNKNLGYYYICQQAGIKTCWDENKKRLNWIEINSSNIDILSAQFIGRNENEVISQFGEPQRINGQFVYSFVHKVRASALVDSSIDSIDNLGYSLQFSFKQPIDKARIVSAISLVADVNY